MTSVEAIGAPVTSCPSCGARARSRPALPEPPFPASPECWAAYGELSAYDLERARPDFLHQSAVDAYAAQHPGAPARPITLWFALVGLHLAVDLGRNGREVQYVHTLLARRPRVWEALPAASVLDRATTVGDVLAEPAGDARDAAILDWAASVWACWHDEHAAVRAVLETL